MKSAPSGRTSAIVFEDDDLIVADKPAGLLTIGTTRERRKTLYARLYDLLKRRRPRERIFVVHRLDRDASGLVVFAKTPEAKLALQAQFKQRTAGRRYVAWVDGVVERDELTLRSWLAENAARNVWSTGPERGGKLAITHVHVLSRRRSRTLVEATLQTGRKHQIRVQLAAAGHPISGDRRYGPREATSHRLELHATSLRFLHPRSGAPLEFRSPAPWSRGYRERTHVISRSTPSLKRSGSGKRLRTRKPGVSKS
jgi:23S rRNA pseudouridine1911/1915/1917 synthase